MQEESKREIKWMKWVDPFGRNKDDFLGYVEEKDVKNHDNDMNEIFEDEEIEINDSNNFVLTQLGVIPIQPFNDPTKFFNFWLGETNFTIDEDVGDIIDNAEGVEIFNVYTRYKFRIAIGNLFKSMDVKHNLEKKLGVFR